MNDSLSIGKFHFKSRLLLGTGKFQNSNIMVKSIIAAKTEIVTVAVRRFNLYKPEQDILSPLLQIKGINLMPNTSGARNAEEAVKIAIAAREITESPLIKLEIHPNPHHLMPDPIETFKAAEILVKEGFTVLPYMPADPVLAKKLEDVGCAAVMPLGSAIGSGQGLRTSELLRLIINDSNVPVIVDAGLRSPSDAAAAMEMGCDAVLVNSAIAIADNPEEMALAFAEAVVAGRRAFLAGLMPTTDTASPTSPTEPMF